MDSLNPKPRRQLTPEARERMRLGQHKGLMRAVAKRKADSSADYATNFDHGQTASDFERSAEAAGETREEVRSHLSLVDRALLTLCGFFPGIAEALSGGVSRSTFESPLTPGSELPIGDSRLPTEGPPGADRQSTIENRQFRAGGEGAAQSPAGQEPRLPLRSDAASPRPPKLARALGLLLWRPLRLFRTQEHWEWLALCYRLNRLVGWRQTHGDLTVDGVEQFRQQVEGIFDNFIREVDWRLKRIEKRFWKVWPLYRGLVGVVEAVFGVRDSRLEARDSELPIADCRLPIEEPPAAELRDLGTETRDSALPIEEPPEDNRQSKIENRQCLIQLRGTPHYEQFHPTWLERIDELTPEAIANPFQSPSHTLNAQRKRKQTAAVKDPKQWQERAGKPRLDPDSALGARLPEMDSPARPARYLVRDPSERELRRLVRSGELTVPGSFEEFADLVEAAVGPGSRGSGKDTRDSGLGSRDSGLGSRDSGLGARESPNPENRTPNPGSRVPDPESRASSPESRALAEALWNRTHVFSARTAELRELLEATLLWQPVRLLALWPKLLPAGYGHDMVILFRRAHAPGHEDIAWGEPEPGEPRRKRRQPHPAVVPRPEAEGRRKRAGELQRALNIWFVAVWHALVPAIRTSHQVTVALYEWAVSRFGIREEFLIWRPNLSLAQLDTREGRPEWAARVVTVTGKTLVRLKDGKLFEPEG